VHLVSITFLVLAILCFWHAAKNKILILYGVFALSLFVMLRPRVCPVPKNSLHREGYPQLFKIIDKVQAALKAPAVGYVVVDEQFNASFGNTGWLWRPTLTLGYPLLHVLSTEEKIHLIAHELAHGVNRDPARSFIAGTAVETLNRWYDLLANHDWQASPDHESTASLLAYWGAYIGRWAMRVLSIIPLALSKLLCHLIWQDSQQAEYLADRLAAKVAGQTASISGLYKLNYGLVVEQSIQQAVMRREDTTLWERLDKNLSALPEHELERLKRLMTKEDARLETTHPPTGHRVAAIQALPVTTPMVILSRSEADAFEDELQRFQNSVAEKLHDDYVNGLYC
jgi:Zn-dependent protease with chaperone function